MGIFKKKKCPQCHEIKLLNTDNFHKSSRTKNGFRSWCKVCQNKANTKFNKDHPDKAVQRVLKSRRSCDNRMKRHVETQEKYVKSEKGHMKYRSTTLKRSYGITLEYYENTLLLQENACKICGKTPEEEGKYLAVDHCHETNTVRGILCQNCNTGLGKFKDSLSLLESAYEYLRSHYESYNPHK